MCCSYGPGLWRLWASVRVWVGVMDKGYADPGSIPGAGEVYVIFGRVSYTKTLELSDLDGTNGFTINGAALSDYVGMSVSSAGDINGDGNPDVIIGAEHADPRGRNSAGKVYIIFGNSTYPKTIKLNLLDGVNGLTINGLDYSNYHTGCSVSSAGDINGDGRSDVIIGAWGANPGGRIDAGQVYVIYSSALFPETTTTSTSSISTSRSSTISSSTSSLTAVSSTVTTVSSLTSSTSVSTVTKSSVSSYDTSSSTISSSISTVTESSTSTSTISSASSVISSVDTTQEKPDTTELVVDPDPESSSSSAGVIWGVVAAVAALGVIGFLVWRYKYKGESYKGDEEQSAVYSNPAFEGAKIVVVGDFENPLEKDTKQAEESNPEDHYESYLAEELEAVESNLKSYTNYEIPVRKEKTEPGSKEPALDTELYVLEDQEYYTDLTGNARHYDADA